MATYLRSGLSVSTNGKNIAVGVTASPTLIHTAVNSSSVNTWDEIYLYAYNGNVSDLELIILWGGTASTDETRITIPSKSGRYLVIDGKMLQNSLLVKAYTSVSGAILIDGYVNSIT